MIENELGIIIGLEIHVEVTNFKNKCFAVAQRITEERNLTQTCVQHAWVCLEVYQL